MNVALRPWQAPPTRSSSVGRRGGGSRCDAAVRRSVSVADAHLHDSRRRARLLVRAVQAFRSRRLDGPVRRSKPRQYRARLRHRTREADTRARSGKSQVITATFRTKGAFTFLCSVSGHARLGMKGTFGVSTKPSPAKPPPPVDTLRSRLADACRNVRSTGARHRAARRHPSTLRRRADRNRADRPGRRGPPHAVPRPAREGQGHERARAAVDRLRARLRDERALLRLLQLDGRQRRHPHLRVPATSRPIRTSPTRTPSGCCSPSSSRGRTTTAGCSSSAPTAISTPRSGTVTAASSTRPASSPSARTSLLGNDPPHRPAARRSVRSPGRQPVRRRRRCPSGDLGLRPSQPVAILDRRGQRKPLRRRMRERRSARRSTWLRADRRDSTSAGRASRARVPFDATANCSGATAAVARIRARRARTAPSIGGVVVRDGRLPALAGRYLYGDFCTGRITSVDGRRTAPLRRAATSGSRCPS